MNAKNTTLIGLFALFALLLLFNSFQIMGLHSLVQEKMNEAQEKARPAKIEIITLSAANCIQCSGLENERQKISAQNVEIVQEQEIEASTSQGQALLQEHSIQQLPALIISGETKKNTQLENFWKNMGSRINDANEVVLETSTAPYFDAIAKKTKGLVNVIKLTANQCRECVALDSLVDAVKQNGVVVQSEEATDFSDSQARDLINRYGIQQAPAILFSKDIEEYPAILEQLKQLNAQEKNGYYPVHSIVPPYVDAATGQTQGLVELISLVDITCTECYDVTINKSILKRFGVYVASDRTIDVSLDEGKQLIQQYAIEKAPSILMSPSASAYSSLNSAWNDVGTIEGNGWFVMRKPELIGTYKNLTTGAVVNPATQANASTS